MEIKFVSNFRYLLVRLCACVIIFVFIVVGICVQIYNGKADTQPIINYVSNFVILVILSMLYLYAFQTVTADNAVITARNVFGVMEKIEFSRIQSIYVEDTVLYYTRGRRAVTRPCIVISTNKTEKRVRSCYTKKSRGNIVLPDIADNRERLSLAYKKATGDDLEWGVKIVRIVRFS